MTAHVERSAGTRTVAYARREWETAYESLVAAEAEAHLEAGDLELLARSAYLLGLDDGCTSSCSDAGAK